MSGQKEIIVFLGNPGRGKSTLLNQVLGKHVFDAGYGVKGVTTVASSVMFGNVTYTDTPGLNDAQKEQRERSAEEVKRVMDEGGAYRFFFVLNTTRAGRADKTDLTLVSNVANTLLQVIPKDKLSYSIIFNQIRKRDKKEELKECFTQAVQFPAHDFFWFEELDDFEDNDIIDNEQVKQLRDFIEKAPRVTLKPNSVPLITTDQEKLDKIEEEYAKFLAEKKTRGNDWTGDDYAKVAAAILPFLGDVVGKSLDYAGAKDANKAGAKKGGGKGNKKQITTKVN